MEGVLVFSHFFVFLHCTCQAEENVSVVKCPANATHAATQWFNSVTVQS